MLDCYICGGPLHSFMTTPLLELDNGKYAECCKECADKEFPGWDDEESDGMD